MKLMKHGCAHCAVMKHNTTKFYQNSLFFVIFFSNNHYIQVIQLQYKDGVQNINT
jgi:hypothetical protein